MTDDTTNLPAPGLRWVAVGAGQMALTHRPKLRAAPLFRAEGCTRLVTLLATREGAEHIGGLAREAGMEWTWLPLASSRTTTDESVLRRVEDGLIALAANLDHGEALALHCSAGIHRTGIVAYALLRTCGYTAEQALELIAQMRPLTRANLTGERLRFAEAIAADTHR
jgi:predicted protein tyrosine phosphatase